MKNENEVSSDAIPQRIDYYKEVLESINFEDIRETIANRFVETADYDFGNYSYEQANERALDYGIYMANVVEQLIRDYIEEIVVDQHELHEQLLNRYLSKTYPD